MQRKGPDVIHLTSDRKITKHATYVLYVILIFICFFGNNFSSNELCAQDVNVFKNAFPDLLLELGPVCGSCSRFVR